MKLSQDEELEKRRERNRLAQRRFRERRNIKTKSPTIQLMALDCMEDPFTLHPAVFGSQILQPPSSSNVIPNSTTETVPLLSVEGTIQGSAGLDSSKSPSHAFGMPLSQPVPDTQYPKGIYSLAPLNQRACSDASNTPVNPDMISLPLSSWLSPLHIAAQKGHDKIVALLVQHSTDCNERDSDGTTPLIHAVKGGHQDVVSTLLRGAARVAEADGDGRSSLHWAVVREHTAILTHLLENCHGLGAAVNAYDNNGQTPLSLAAEIGLEEGVRILLRYGAHTSLKAIAASEAIVQLDG